ncbi:TDRD6 protein, partial [Amia calva]|nr:TDRD6 protein [Amia calva]
MCSIPGLPTPGSKITVHLTRVNLNPLCVLVELWANFDKEKKSEYQQMRAEIQFPKEKFKDAEGNPGDLCLVQILETWYRARVVSRNGPDYNVFLIDEGRTLAVGAYHLAWGHNIFFHLPPEVEFCVLANILPLSPENKWSPMALEFLKSLCGRTVEGYVQDVLVPHRAFLIDIPSISKQMYEMGFAKKLSSEMFKFYVERSLQSFTGTMACPESNRISSHVRIEPSESSVVHKSKLDIKQGYFYPQLQADTVEMVTVTELTNPLRFFCQLRIFSQELKKLTDQMMQKYEGRLSAENIRPEALGFPCASRGSDGKWYRSILQQVFPCKNLVEVLHVDYGKKEFVPIGNIRPLAPEFFRMPVVTYMCSMLGITDQGAGWSASQIDFLKSLLLHRVVIGKFEYQSYSEGVYYVTLYGDDNLNLNNLFGMKEKCLIESEKLHGDYAIVRTTIAPKAQTLLGSRVQRSSPIPCGTGTEEMLAKTSTPNLKLNSTYEAVVEYVISPSEFWIQTQEYAIEFDQLMNDIVDLYDNASRMEGVIRTPTVGLFCVAKSKDDVFYRAIVSEVLGEQAKVYFVDYGNTETVAWYNLKVLPTKYQEIPALALKCCLHGVRPKDENWSQNAISFFTKAVGDKVLQVYTYAKLHDKYAVQLTDASAEEGNINCLMCNAGFAEYEDVKKSVPRLQRMPLPMPTVQNQSVKTLLNVTRESNPCSLPTSIIAGSETRTVFKEHLFPIGSNIDVTVSYIESPNDFWCQMSKSGGSLNLLMQDIQKYYADSPDTYLPVEAACIARLPGNGIWYRALIIRKHASLEVDVLLIDYGNTERVPLKDLRAINPAFIQLKGQAFRCSLYNLIHPSGQDPLKWSDAAISEFQQFVDSAASSHLDMKCTIYAVMYDSNKVVFNVVDLETPFQSVCSLLVQKGLAQRAPLKKAPHPPFRLDTYYYSMHNIKTGGEEEVCVTHVKSVGHFYCQLGRNSDMVDKLAEKVNYLCQQLERIDCPQTFGTVCFAKYSDGQWYRGQIKSVFPKIQVYFVDYGDMQEVDKSDLLPIPIEASDLMSVPVQAVHCGLVDVPADVPSDVNSWFESIVIGKCFRALVVAKEPCGKLMIELYDGKMQLNSKIKDTFQIEALRQSVALGCSVTKFPRPETMACKTKDEFKARSLPQMSDLKNRKEKDIQSFHKDACQQPQREVKQFSSVGIQWEPEEESFGDSKNGHKQQIPPSKSEYSAAPTVKSGSSLNNPETNSHAVSNSKDQSILSVNSLVMPKLADLPSKCLKPGQVKEVYVSHVNNPSSFFVQLTEEEDEIFSIVEKLNQDLVSIEFRKLELDDLVCAEFPDDNSWYRAVVRNTFPNGTVLVEFIDFGNTATISSSKICWLHKKFLKAPRFSIHCLLNGVQSTNSNSEWGQEAGLHFKQATENGEKFTCSFIKITGSLWEVSLQDQSTTLTDHLITSGFAVNFDNVLKEPESPQTSSGRDISEENQTIEVYGSCLVGPEYFWCQYANSNDLQRIAEVADQTGNNEAGHICVEALYPGSPCLALFSEDGHWYRAELKAKTNHALSILFVDYGNEVEVDENCLKSMPSPLFKIPTQAFLCQLEGFNLSHGSWDSNAADKFYELLLDQLLNVTILKWEDFGNGEPPKFHVKVECNGQVVNDLMRNYWKTCTSVDITLANSELAALSESFPCEDETEVTLEVQRTVNEFLAHPEEQSTSVTLSIEQCLPEQYEKVVMELHDEYEATNGTMHLDVQSVFSSEEQLEDGKVTQVEITKQASGSEKIHTGFEEQSAESTRETFKDEAETEVDEPLVAETGVQNTDAQVLQAVTEDLEDPEEETIHADIDPCGLCDPQRIGNVEVVSQAAHVQIDLQGMVSLEERPKCISAGTGEQIEATSKETDECKTLKILLEESNLDKETPTIKPIMDFQGTGVDPTISKTLGLQTSSLLEFPCKLNEAVQVCQQAEESFELLDSHEDEQAEYSDIYEEVFKQCCSEPVCQDRPVPEEAGDAPASMDVVHVVQVQEDAQKTRIEPGW